MKRAKKTVICCMPGLSYRARLHWMQYDIKQWCESFGSPPYRVMAFICRLLHRKVYRMLPDEMKKATLASAVSRLTFDRYLGKQAEDNAARLSVEVVKLEREVANLRLQMSCHSIPQYKKILDMFGLEERDVN